MRLPFALRLWLQEHRATVLVVLALAVLPFALGLLEGQTPAQVVGSEAGNSKFVQGLLIEIFILGLYALSYDLVLGITGLLSFGHSMFFAVGAYTAGILIKSFGWPLWATVLGVIAASVVQAALFSIVLPRVKGITFALVTLGLASVFHIIVQSRELEPWTGSDVGLQGVNPPALLDPATARLSFFFAALALTVLAFAAYRRFVDSPTGKVCTAIRENEQRALMLGYNTFYYKFIALLLASLTAALAGMLHAFYQPIVSPNLAGVGFTVSALLIILIGGVGTLSGALVGAAVFRLLEFFLSRLFSENASFLLGLIYVALVLFLPFGLVGTWRARQTQLREGWESLRALFQRQP
jgi:branched-chain amino acid transport system permease protein